MFCQRKHTALSYSSFNTATILRIYFKRALFHRLLHFYISMTGDAKIGFDQISSRVRLRRQEISVRAGAIMALGTGLLLLFSHFLLLPIGQTQR